jgi:hypothetical protein
MTTRRGQSAPDLTGVAEKLMDFQRTTADYVIDAMFRANEPQRHFLVADEVGLGKTKIARAVVAETITRLWDDPSVDRIDIVYICSNHQIARQNIQDLNVLEQAGTNRFADRITMLPKILGGLNKQRVNLVHSHQAPPWTWGAGAGVPTNAPCCTTCCRTMTFGAGRCWRVKAHTGCSHST